MDRYDVRYSPKAVSDLQSAFDWGMEYWGREYASKWAVRFEELIDERLSFSPMAWGPAPESAGRQFEIRQLVIHRYRVLFTIEDKTVYILRIRGPFSGRDLEIERPDAS